MNTSPPICALCRKTILPTEAVAVLVKEGTSRLPVHVSCLVNDLAMP